MSRHALPDPSQPHQPADSPSDLPPQTRQRTLLLVDDEAAILSSLKRLFRRDGYHILTATSGAQGLDMLAQQPVDVILSDQRMPGMTGIEFMREARRLYPGTVRITLSGYTDLQSIIEAVNEGAVYKFLTKPWEDDLLRGHVAQAFAQSELAAENRRLTEVVRQANQELATANQRLERLVRDENQLRLAMQNAAGASRDALDALPMAVFGLSVDGMLVYVNRMAVRQFPHWSSVLGGAPEPSMQLLLSRLQTHPHRCGDAGHCTDIEGDAISIWVRSLTGPQHPLGQLVFMQRQQACAPVAREPSA